MKTIIAITLLLTTYLAHSEQQRFDDFPSSVQLYEVFREVNRDFLAATKGKDCWEGFIPLVEAAVKYQDEASKKSVLEIEEDIIDRFVIYSFAGRYDDDFVKANFESRLAIIRRFSKFVVVKNNKKTILKLADWLSLAQPLSVDKETECAESAMALQKDNEMIYGSAHPPRYPGVAGNFSHLGPFARQCKERFRFRRIYNERVAKFRVDALYILREVVIGGCNDETKDERQNVWEEVCRRAKATVEECKRIGCSH